MLCRRPLKGVILTQSHQIGVTGMTLCSATIPDSIYPKLTIDNACIGNVKSVPLKTVLFSVTNSVVRVWGAINNNFRSSLIILRNTLLCDSLIKCYAQNFFD